MNSYTFTGIITILIVVLISTMVGSEYRLDLLLTKLQNIGLVTLMFTLFGFFWLGKGYYLEHDKKIFENPIAVALYLGLYAVACGIAISSIA